MVFQRPICIAIWLSVAGSLALVQSNSIEPSPAPQRQIAATVNTTEISTNAAANLLDKSLPNIDNAKQHAELLNAAVNRLIDRAIVYDYLNEINAAAGKNEIRLELEVFKASLKSIEMKLEDHLTATGQIQEELEFEIGWRISWNRYLKQQLTDESMLKYFNDHRRKFDDSEMRVAHLLLQPDENRLLPETIKHADRILEEINSNQLSWNEAVEKHSVAPTRTHGGEIGWIKYDQPMPPAFSVAAFDLQPTDISPPVATHFGVHLIKCLEIKEGKTGWRDALDDLRRQASIDLMQKIANEHRAKLTIKYREGFHSME